MLRSPGNPATSQPLNSSTSQPSFSSSHKHLLFHVSSRDTSQASILKDQRSDLSGERVHSISKNQRGAQGGKVKKKKIIQYRTLPTRKHIVTASYQSKHTVVLLRPYRGAEMGQRLSIHWNALVNGWRPTRQWFNSVSSMD